MGPGEALRLLRKRWLLATAVVLGCLLVAAGLTARAEQKYQATAQLFVSVVLPNDPAALAANNTFATAQVQSYVSLATSAAVTDPVVQQLKLPMTGSALAREVSATAAANKLLVSLVVTDPSQSRVAPIANALAARFSTVVQALQTTQSGGPSPVRVTVTDTATRPSAPVSPRVRLNLALALLGGLLLAFGAVRLREATDIGITGVDELERLAACPVLGVVPRDRRLARETGSVGPGGRSLAGQAFALVAAHLEVLTVSSPISTLAVTSAVAGEGKTFVAVHLAGRLARNGMTVCLVDVDLRAPRLAARLGVPSTPGLSRVLLRSESADGLVRALSPGLSVVVAGAVPPHPTQLLASPEAHKTVQELTRSFHSCVLDGGAVLPHDDGVRAAVLAEATLLVVLARRTHRRDLVTAVEHLSAAGVRPVGVVLTGASARSTRAYLRAHADSFAGPSIQV